MNIKFNEVNKRVNDQQSIDELNMSLVSPNKYILRCNDDIKDIIIDVMLGVSKLDSGEIIVNDKVMNKDIKIIKGVGLSLEEPAFIENMSVDDNLKYFLSKDKRKIAYELIDKFEINITKKQKMCKYTLNDLKVLSIIRAIADSEDLLILDNPFNGLNVELKDNILNYLSNLNNKIILIFDNKDRSIDGFISLDV